MKDKLQFYINGAWVESDSSERIEVINPANEEVVGHVTAGTAADIDKAVQLSHSHCLTTTCKIFVQRIYIIIMNKQNLPFIPMNY